MSSLIRRIQRGWHRKGKAIRNRLERGSLPKSINPTPASINRRTGKPHEHKRAIARRLRQMGRV